MSKSNNPLDDHNFSIPADGMPEDVRNRLMSVYNEFIFEQKKWFLGYQANQKMSYEADTKQFLNCHINNVGDPFVGGNFTVNSKHMERAVLDYYAKLWHAKIPQDRKNPAPDSYWGMP
jgi:histidine decarboxylase